MNRIITTSIGAFLIGSAAFFTWTMAPVSGQLQTDNKKQEIPTFASAALTPREVISKYHSLALAQNEAELKKLVTKIPRSYWDYVLNKSDSSRKGVSNKTSSQTKPPTEVILMSDDEGYEKISRSTISSDFAINVLPQLLREGEYEIAEIGNAKIKGSDSKVVVKFRSRLDPRFLDSYLFLLHKEDDEWKIFKIESTFVDLDFLNS